MFLLAMAMTLSFCTTSKKAAATKSNDPTYAVDIAPLLQQNCAPCHFPNGGRMKFLDTQNAVKENIDHIIMRVSLPVGTKGFMPFKSDVALSESQIQLLKDWKESGMN